MELFSNKKKNPNGFMRLVNIMSSENWIESRIDNKMIVWDLIENFQLIRVFLIKDE